jgi:hypothetical protein
LCIESSFSKLPDSFIELARHSVQEIKIGNVDFAHPQAIFLALYWLHLKFEVVIIVVVIYCFDEAFKIDAFT